MNTKDTGGPALPRQHAEADANSPAFKLGSEGMTLRDYFAGQVLAGAATGMENLGNATKEKRSKALSETAAILYEIADAMLAARSKP